MIIPQGQWARWPGGHDVLDYGYVHVGSASVPYCVSASAFYVSQLFVLVVWRVEEDVVDLYYLRLVGACSISVGTGRVTVQVGGALCGGYWDVAGWR